jgi:hypothetical protein
MNDPFMNKLIQSLLFTNEMMDKRYIKQKRKYFIHIPDNMVCMSEISNWTFLHIFHILLYIQ